MTKPTKYLAIALIVDSGIVFIAIALLVVTLALGYKGTCGVIVMGGVDPPCSFLEYMQKNLGFYLLVLVYYFWWLLLLLFVVIPGVAYFVGQVRTR